MLEFMQVSVLALLQGISEFLPISSSGHLILCEHWLGCTQQGVRLDVFLHVGTVISVVIFYFSILRRIVVEREWSYFLKVVLSAIPAGVLGLILRDQLEGFKQYPGVVGWLLGVTGIVLIATRFIPLGLKKIGWLSAMVMGLVQAAAIFPGISRSGTTIAAARVMKIDPEKAAEFSFLMSLPVILGAALVQIAESGAGAAGNEVGWGLSLYGCAVAAFIGYLALQVLLGMLKTDKFWLFGVYCLVAAASTLIS